MNPIDDFSLPFFSLFFKDWPPTIGRHKVKSDAQDEFANCQIWPTPHNSLAPSIHFSPKTSSNILGLLHSKVHPTLVSFFIAPLLAPKVLLEDC